MPTVVSCENYKYAVKDVEVTIIEYDAEANPKEVARDVFKEFCKTQFRPIGASGGLLGCSEGEEKPSSLIERS